MAWTSSWLSLEQSTESSSIFWLQKTTSLQIFYQHNFRQYCLPSSNSLILHQHFYRAEAVDGITGIMYNSLHTTTRRQGPNSRLSHLSASCPDMQSVYRLRSERNRSCRMTNSHLAVISHLGELSEYTGMSFVTHRHGQSSNHLVPSEYLGTSLELCPTESKDNKMYLHSQMIDYKWL